MRGQEENRDIGDLASFLAPVVAIKERQGDVQNNSGGEVCR